MNAAAPDFAVGALEMGLMGVGVIFSLIALVCSIMVCVKMFQNDQTALGVISLVLMFCTGIGYLITLIFGWMKSSEWNIKGLMTVYTATILLGIVLFGAGYGILIAKVVKEVQNDPNFQQQMEQFEVPEIEIEGVPDIEAEDVVEETAQ
jgi:hypothetical protein